MDEFPIKILTIKDEISKKCKISIYHKTVMSQISKKCCIQTDKRVHVSRESKGQS